MAPRAAHLGVRQHPLPNASARASTIADRLSAPVRVRRRISVIEDVKTRRAENRDALTAELESIMIYKDRCLSETERMAKIAAGEE